jgi:hypothetical protein
LRDREQRRLKKEQERERQERISEMNDGELKIFDFRSSYLMDYGYGHIIIMALSLDDAKEKIKEYYVLERDGVPKEVLKDLEDDPDITRLNEVLEIGGSA